MQKVEIQGIGKFRSTLVTTGGILTFISMPKGTLSIEITRLFMFSRCHSKWKIFVGWYPNAFLKYKSLVQEKGI